MSEDRRNASQNAFNAPTIGELLHQLSVFNKSLVRKLEKCNKKLIQNKYDILFNETCINEELLPKYTNIRLHDPVAKEEKFTDEYRKELIKFQLEKHKAERDKITLNVQQLKDSIAENIGNNDLKNKYLKS